MVRVFVQALGSHVLAAADAASPGLSGDWGLLVNIAQLGTVGVVLICILTGKYIVPELFVRRQQEALKSAAADAEKQASVLLADTVKQYELRLAEAQRQYEVRLVDAKNSHAEAITNRDTTIIEEKAKNERYSRLIEERVVPTLVQANQLAANYAEDMRRRTEAAGHAQ